MTFKIHTLDNAPASTHATLKKMSEKYGFLPHFAGILAGSPPLLEAYAALDKLMQETSFTVTERYIILLSVSAANNCGYCMALLSKEAENDDIAIEIIDDLRAGTAIGDEKLEALRAYTIALVKNNGHPPSEIKERFLKAGYGPAQALEIILAIGIATLSNYTNRLAHPPLDKALEDTIWHHEEAA